MSRNWENTFSLWAKPPAKTEETRCQNAEKAIRNAIAASSSLNQRDIRVFTQGSYQNNTNVRKDSDVDVGVTCYDIFFPEYPEGITGETFGHPDGNYGYSTFKNEIEQALVDYFGRHTVTRGNKAFDIKENTYHVEADVAPFFEHRRYQSNGDYSSGVELRPDDNMFKKLINWPKQHYENGVNKNKQTSRRFKSLVRIVKSLCNEMCECDIPQAMPIPGFLIECLVWNVPNNCFGYTTWKTDVRECLAYLFNNTLTDDKCSEWGEVSELKYLFRTSQKWSRQQAHSFIDAAWNYVGFQ